MCSLDGEDVLLHPFLLSAWQHVDWAAPSSSAPKKNSDVTPTTWYRWLAHLDEESAREFRGSVWERRCRGFLHPDEPEDQLLPNQELFGVHLIPGGAQPDEDHSLSRQQQNTPDDLISLLQPLSYEFMVRKILFPVSTTKHHHVHLLVFGGGDLKDSSQLLGALLRTHGRGRLSGTEFCLCPSYPTSASLCGDDDLRQELCAVVYHCAQFLPEIIIPTE